MLETYICRHSSLIIGKASTLLRTQDLETWTIVLRQKRNQPNYSNHLEFDEGTHSVREDFLNMEIVVISILNFATRTCSLHLGCWYFALWLQYVRNVGHI